MLNILNKGETKVKIDKKTIDMLCRMPDDKLWGTVKMIASSAGVDLSSKRMSPRDMQKLRYTLGTLTDGDISRATEIIKTYKNGR